MPDEGSGGSAVQAPRYGLDQAIYLGRWRGSSFLASRFVEMMWSYHLTDFFAFQQFSCL